MSDNFLVSHELTPDAMFGVIAVMCPLLLAPNWVTILWLRRHRCRRAEP